MIKYKDLIIGNKAVNSVIKDFSEGAGGHAYLIVCDDSEVLHNTLMIICQSILCQNVDDKDKQLICERIVGGNHANVHAYDTYKDSIVRELVATTYIKPLEEGKNIFVLNYAESMTVKSQNILLKTIEEPQNNVVILLGCNNDMSLLPTIKSRAKKIHVNIWTTEIIRKSLEAGGYGEAEINLATQLCNGSMTRAVELVNNPDCIEKYNRIMQMLNGLITSQQIPEYVDCLGKDNKELLEMLNLMELIFGNVIKSGNNTAEPILCGRYNIRAAVNIIDKIIECKSLTNVNVNTENIVGNLLMAILEIRYRTM